MSAGNFYAIGKREKRMNSLEIKRFGLHHTFDVDLATELKSLDLAVLVHHFQFWIRHNASTGKAFQDGKTWMYQSLKEIAASFPYWSVKQVERFINKLVEVGILVKGNFNSNKYDRTAWYSFKNEERFAISRNREIEICESGNRNREVGNCNYDKDTKEKISKEDNTPPTPKGVAAKAAKVCVSNHAKDLTEKIIQVMKEIRPTCKIPKSKDTWYEAAQEIIDRGIEIEEALKVFSWALNDNTKKGDWGGWSKPFWNSKNKAHYLNERYDTLHTQMHTKPEKRGFLPCSDDDLALEEYRSCGEVVE